jgi:hypothetical protein
MITQYETYDILQNKFGKLLEKSLFHDIMNNETKIKLVKEIVGEMVEAVMAKRQADITEHNDEDKELDVDFQDKTYCSDVMLHSYHYFYEICDLEFSLSQSSPVLYLYIFYLLFL